MATALATGVSCWPAPSQSVTPGRALFAKGLAKGCTSAHLQAIFSQFGTVTDCQIARHRSGRSAGFAIVTFLRHEEAVAAMQTVDNMMFMGRRLSVKWFSPERALEGSSNGVDALNMQALQHALQLSQLQPADLMAQLAQMLESPRLAPQQPQNPHVAAWLDNFILAQQRDSPLAPPMPDAAAQPQPAPLDLLNFSALSLADLPGAAALGLPPAPGLPTHPNTPSALDIPDGAVFVTATAIPAVGKGAVVGPGGAGANNLSHSRLAKWCTAPGSAGGQSSAAPSLADDASSASETASVHASDDSSVATTVQIANVSCDIPTSCCTEGTTSSMVALLAGADNSSPATAVPASAAPVVTTTASSPRASFSTVPSATLTGPTSSLQLGDPAADEFMRQRALAAAAAAAGMAYRPGVVGSDPGTLQPGSFNFANRASGPTSLAGSPPLLQGMPPLTPLRTVPSAPQPSASHHHHSHHLHPHHHGHQHHYQLHHHHMATRGGTQSARQSASMVPPYSCAGGSASAAAVPSAATPDAAGFHQALRLQQVLAEQARTINAQQQYVDALTKLAAARDQVMAAASLLNGTGSSSSTGGIPTMPASLATGHAPHHPHHHQHHHHHNAMASSMAGPHGMMGGMPGAPSSVGLNPFMNAQSAAAAAAAQTPGGVPDLSTFLMLQNAAAMNRPLY